MYEVQKYNGPYFSQIFEINKNINIKGTDANIPAAKIEDSHIAT